MSFDFLDRELLIVFIAALITALATGLGVLPFIFKKDISPKWSSISNAIAAGLMLAACFGLLFEATALDELKSAGGFLTGLLVILVTNELLNRWEHPDIADLDGINAKRALLILGVMTIHSFAEGIGVGVSFGGGDALGTSITFAIAVHNIPEGLAIALVLIPRGTGILKASMWSVFTSLPQPLMAVPAFIFVLIFEPLLPFGLALAAGAMLWMIFSELIPESLKELSPASTGFFVSLSFLLMYMYQNYLMS